MKNQHDEYFFSHYTPTTPIVTEAEWEELWQEIKEMNAPGGVA